MQQSDTYTMQPAATANKDGSIPSPAGCPPMLNDMQLSDIAALTTSGVGLFRIFSEAARLTQTGQVRPFDVYFSQEIGGYPKTALVTDVNNPTRLFISTKDDNNTDPTTDKSGAWFPLTDSITAIRDAIAKEEQRAQSAEAALQPKGDYATNDGLNAETNRAKSVEATLQPKGDYATHSDLSAESQRAQNAEATLQPKGDYATNDGLNAETNRAKSVEATLQPKGDYATHSDLSAEAQRAQNAEATLQPKGDYATNDGLNAETNRAKSVEATLQPKGDYATHSDLSAEAQRAQNAEATLQPKGDYATNDGLNAETNRAKSVEATLQPKGDYATRNDLSGFYPKTGGQLIGSVEVEDPSDDSRCRLLPQQQKNGYVEVVTSKGVLQAGMLQHQISQYGIAAASLDFKEYSEWIFDGKAQSLTAPSRNAYPEVLGSTSRTVIQAWKVVVKNHDWVSFPEAFSSTPMNLQLTAEHYPNGSPSVLVNYYEPSLTNQGFKIDLRWMDDGISGSEETPRTVNILAIGTM